MKSKLHRATVTATMIDYEGSIGIDSQLMDLANILPYEQVEVYNINNGARFSTYAIPWQAGSGGICINGAAARLAVPGDLVIIVTYGQLETSEVAQHRPRVVALDPHNRPV